MRVHFQVTFAVVGCGKLELLCVEGDQRGLAELGLDVGAGPLDRAEWDAHVRLLRSRGWRIVSGADYSTVDQERWLFKRIGDATVSLN